MYFTLGLKKLPFELEEKQIIYIQGNTDRDVEFLIMRNYHNIHSYFASQGYDFCYIPYLKRELDRYEVLHYNAPYCKNGHLKYITDDNFILNYMTNPEGKESMQPSLLYYIPGYVDEECRDAECQMRGFTLTESSFKGDDKLEGALNHILNDIYEKKSSPKESATDSDIESNVDNLLLSADDTFDHEAKVMIQEVQSRIEELKKKGISTYIIKRLALNTNERLSRLHITKRYDILLIDYFMEIKMTPIQKAVFLLFLNHPEGIIFKHLPDYQEELLDIYKKVRGYRYDKENAMKSIMDVTDPLKNSINEKCSRIREAFLSQFDDYLAHYYYIDGQRGEPKKILLPRDLVKWD